MKIVLKKKIRNKKTKTKDKAKKMPYPPICRPEGAPERWKPDVALAYALLCRAWAKGLEDYWVRMKYLSFLSGWKVLELARMLMIVNLKQKKGKK